jgi:hypothetical protein
LIFTKPFPLAFVSENINNAFEIIASYHSRHDLAENSSLGIAQQTLTHIFKGHTSRPGEWKPELGDYVGYLTDEVPDNSIIEFVTDGPKNYAYKIARPDTTLLSKTILLSFS